MYIKEFKKIDSIHYVFILSNNLEIKYRLVNFGKSYWFSCCGNRNDHIFDLLCISKYDLCRKIGSSHFRSGSWPESNKEKLFELIDLLIKTSRIKNEF